MPHVDADEDRNIDIARKIFGIANEILDAWPWGVPEFSSDRRWSAAVVTAMWSKPDNVRLEFERQMLELAARMKLKGGLVEAMVVNTPDEICKAALTALAECDRVERYGSPRIP